MAQEAYSPKVLVAGGTGVGHEEVLPPVDISFNYNVTLVLSALSIHKASGALSNGCPQERSFSRFCRNKFQKQPTFNKPVATGKFSSYPLKKKSNQPEDKMLSNRNYDKRNGNQIASDRTTILTVSQR